MYTSPVFLLTGNLMIGLVVCTAYWWRKRHLVPWAYFLWGGGAWLAALVARTAWLMQVTPDRAPGFPLQLLFWGGLADWGGLLLCALGSKRLRQANFSQAVALGLGFGATESLIVAIATLSSTLGVLAGFLQPGAAPTLQGPLLFWALAPVVDRALALAIDAAAGAWIVYGVRTRSWPYLVLALAGKISMSALSGDFARDLLRITWIGPIAGLALGGAGLVYLACRGLPALAGRYPRAAQPNLSADLTSI